MLAPLLVRRGDVDELRARADAGDYRAARWLPEVLARRGDLGEAAQVLRARADNGGFCDWMTAEVLAELLAERGDLDEAAQVSDLAIRILRAEAKTGFQHVARQLAEALARRGGWDELRARADAGDWPAARRFGQAPSTEHGDPDEAEQVCNRAIQGLRAQADEWHADWLLPGGAAWDEVFARIVTMDPFASFRLAEALAENGDLDEPARPGQRRRPVCRQAACRGAGRAWGPG